MFNLYKTLVFPDHGEIQFVANRAAEEHNFHDWEFGQAIPDEFLDYNFVRNAHADLEVQQQLGNLDLAAPEVQIPVPQYLPHGVTLDDYLSRDYREYRRGFILRGIYQFYPNNWYNDPARSSDANSESSQVRGRRAGTHNKLNRLLRLVGALYKRCKGESRMADAGNGNQRSRQSKNMREAANRLAHNLKTEGGSFEGKVNERVLGFIVHAITLMMRIKCVIDIVDK